jgi:hypothetical protein
MGKAAKVIVPVAAIGVGIWATGGIGASGWLYNTSTLAASSMGTALPAPGLLQMAGSGLSSIFSSVSSSISSNKLGYGLAGVSAFSSIMAGDERRDDALLRQQEEERRMRSIRLGALQAEAAALKRGSASRGAAIAKAVAQGQDIRSSRSFLAFLDDQEREVQQQVGSIRVNAEAGIQTSQIRFRQFGKQGTAAMFEGVGSAARSLLAVV